MAKGGSRKKNGRKNSKFSNQKSVKTEKISFGEENMDDEIDAFHKQRDMVPIDRNDDTDRVLDGDEELPVFDFKGLNDDTDDSDIDDSGDDDVIAKKDKDHEKMVKQQRILRKKYGGVEDDVSEDSDGEEKRKASFGRGKQFLYGADNIDFELQSDDDDLAEEEAIAMMLQKEKAKSLSLDDFGLEDVDGKECDEQTDNKAFQSIFSRESHSSKSGLLKDEAFEGHVEVKKDINALTKEEQMDIVYSSSPELIGLLSELNEAVDQLHSLKPLLQKMKNTKGMKYFETKQKILLAYIQYITFYLLLKSEGHPVRDHPVIGRLVELKNLWEKVKKIDVAVSPFLGAISDNGSAKVSALHSEEEKDGPPLDSDIVADPTKSLEASGVSKFTENGLSVDDSCPKEGDQKTKKSGLLGHQSLQMFKVRALLEQKLKEKGVFDAVNVNPIKLKNEASEKANRQTEISADFEDDVDEIGPSCRKKRKINMHVPAKIKTTKFVSGDEDLPKRDNIGEKRRKFDLQVMRKSDTGSLMDDDANEAADTKVERVEGEVKRKRLAKLSAKAALKIGTRDSVDALSVENKADGRRPITYEMEKNKGLTRYRKKLTKNPRKKYKLKHANAVVRRKGQVRDIRRPEGPYGGEASGINTRVSHSIRFK